MFKSIFSLFLLVFVLTANAQTDSVKKLNEIMVKGYYQPQPLFRTIAAVNLLDSNQSRNQSTSSLIGLVNTVPGVRMEERSPGSYRLSLRGSLLRSPFGIRNIRIYVDGFPLTDAGGNTYLNVLDAAAVGTMEIYKGPEASTFGANTGGALLINSAFSQTNTAEIALNAGSYGLWHQTAKLAQTYRNYNFSIIQGYQKSDGYRENSALERKYIQTSHQWQYSAKGKLNAFILYSDLHYKTPGGLTASQLALDPKAARPATPTLPSAVQQQAGIYNQTLFGGITNSYSFNSHWKHVISLFTTYTDFKNPFITNFEKRKESSLGFRSFLEFNALKRDIAYTFQAGVESASTKSKIQNFGNEKGKSTTLQASDDLNAQQDFAFVRLNFDIQQQWLVELSSSLNFFNYNYQSYFPLVVAAKQRNFKTRPMPKFAASYLINPDFTVRASISKGYSPPTLAEVRSSDNIINTNLQAEGGWNYEGGLRYRSKNRVMNIDGTVFYFNLQDAIVRRLNANDIEYFINAGGTKQLGTELQLAWWLMKENPNHFLTSLQLQSSYTYSHFKFEDFKNAQQDYSGNKLTGVPTHTVINSLTFNFKKGIYLYAQHNFTSAIPLNDANTVFATKYQLVDLKAGIHHLKLGKTALSVYFGINNLLNEAYSLGNDLNAANNRYFNAAAGINYYTGLAIKL